MCPLDCFRGSAEMTPRILLGKLVEHVFVAVLVLALASKLLNRARANVTTQSTPLAFQAGPTSDTQARLTSLVMWQNESDGNK